MNRTRRFLSPSFRSRILLIVLAVATVPLAMVGLWMSRTASRSGEELLRARLAESLERVAAEVGGSWVRQRYDLLRIAEDEAVQAALRLEGPSPGASHLLGQTSLAAGVERVTVRDSAARSLWDGGPDAGDGTGDRDRAAGPALTVELPIHERGSGRRLGTLEASLRMSALLSERARTSAAAGAVLAAFDSRSGVSLLPIPFDETLLARDDFVWAGEAWLREERTLVEPPLRLVAAAPLAPFTQQFEQAARQGLWVLLGVAAAGMALAALLTGRMTRSLERLASAAEAVSRGELERKVESDRDDEVGRVGRAFNAMTQSLRGTLRQLAEREALAAVGEFAASLAHEVRNPLTAIRLDLQIVEEELPPDSRLRGIQAQALEEIERLDRTVGGALLVARSGRITPRPVQLRRPLRSAMHAAEPQFTARGAGLEVLPAELETTIVQGDAGALEQLFLNLLLNAAQAVGPGGRARVAVRADGPDVVVSVSDDGPGVPAEMRERVFEPFVSTRREGTGLGLAIARRIALAHQGDIRIESGPEAGTTVSVRLPRAEETAGHDPERGAPESSAAPHALPAEEPV